MKKETKIEFFSDNEKPLYDVNTEEISGTYCRCCGVKITKKHNTVMGGLFIRSDSWKRPDCHFCYVCLENITEGFKLLKKPEFYDELKQEVFLRKFVNENNRQ